MNSSLKILYLSSEVSPFSRSGLQGDMAAAIPRSLKRLGHDVRVITPRYRVVLERRFGLREASRLRAVEVSIDGRAYNFSVKSGFIPQSKAQVYFIEKPDYYYLDGLYVHPRTGVAFENNPVRFSFLCHAALQLLLHLQWIPDVLHCYDWQTSLAIFLIQNHPTYLREFQNTRAMLQINWCDQLKSMISEGFPNRIPFPAELNTRTWQREEAFLWLGLKHAEHVLFKTPFPDHDISPEEAAACREYLQALNPRSSFFCERDDCWDWNPVTDSWLAQNYSEADFPFGKVANKRALQREFGLKINPEAPLGVIAFNAENHRAVEILDSVRDKLSLAPAQWVVYEINGLALPPVLTDWKDTYPDRVALISGEIERLIRLAYAAGDFFVLLSDISQPERELKPALYYGIIPVLPELPMIDGAPPDWMACLESYRHNLLFDWSERRLIQRVAELWTLFQDRDAWERGIECALKRLLGWEKLIGNLDNMYAEMINTPVRRKA